MGILDFDTAAKTNTAAASGTNNRRTQAQDRPSAKLWLNVGYDANGRFVMSTGPLPQPGLHRLPTPGRRGLVLTLRLYQPSAELQAAPAKLAAPSIQPIGECAP